MTSTSSYSINLISRHTVRCANESSWKALDSPFRLGPLDQLVSAGIPVAVVFVYEKPASTADVELIPVERLQHAMSRLLDYYPHLSGRMHIGSSDGTPEITRLGTGAELFLARCSERLDVFRSHGHISPGRILMQNLPDAGNALMAPFDSNLDAVFQNPMFTIQHTRFACGGVALGVRVLHKLCDAEGCFQLVRDLAELYCGVLSSEKNGDPSTGVASLTHPPHIRPYLSELIASKMSPDERQAVLDYQPSLFYVEKPVDDTPNPSSFTVAPSAPVSPPPPVVGRFMRFSARELSHLKSLATDPDPNPSSDNWISTFEALAAHLYQCVHRARLQLRVEDPSLDGLSPTDFLSPVNIRTRLGLPPRYFANALICTYTCLPADVLAAGSLWQVAKILHEVTRVPGVTSKEEMSRTLKWMALQPDKRIIQQGFRYGSGSFMISQWNKLDMYTPNTFEVPPVVVSTPFTEISLIDGLGYFLPTEDQGSGDIDVCLALYGSIWDVLDQDREFRRLHEE